MVAKYHGFIFTDVGQRLNVRFALLATLIFFLLGFMLYN